MFKKSLKMALVGAFSLHTMAGVGAFAQSATGSQNCTCVSSSQGAGSVTSAKGNVLVSQASGMRPASAGSALTSQSRIVVGSASSATIGLGNCNVSISGNSQATVSKIGEQMCVKVQSLVVTPAADVGAAENSDVLLGLLALGVVSGGLLAIVLLVDDKNSNNGGPVTP
jgi:hypothetical protein